MSRATEDLLDQLHRLVFDGLNEELARALEAARQPRFIEGDEAGSTKPNPDYVPLNPQLIDKALKALKDNGVDAPARSPRVDALAARLGELDLDDEAVALRTSH